MGICSSTGRPMVSILRGFGTLECPKVSHKVHFLEKWQKWVWIGKYHTISRVRPLRIEVKIDKNVVKISGEFHCSIFSEKVCPKWAQELPWGAFGDHLGPLW